ncbi:MAG TPA: hypothetical protein VGG44_03830 [Tepidisphaeraceae bacterium]|jgi:uncharacterized protein involved in outer membrane biogenesis
MQVIHLKVQGQIEPNGHLHLDVQTQLPAGQADVALTISSNDTAKDNRYEFSDLAGRLAWRGDAVAEQRGIRDEW